MNPPTPEQLIAEARRQAALNHVEDVTAVEDSPEITWTELHDVAQLFSQLADALASALAEPCGYWKETARQYREGLASAQQRIQELEQGDV